MIDDAFELAAEERTSQQIKEKPHVPAASDSISIGKQIEQLRLECEWTVEELAERIGVQPRSVYRHEADDSRPTKLNLRVYSRVFSQVLERTVVIRRMSVNVSKRLKES